jgi:putative SOS response-associated peptidase YedK
VRPFSRIEMPEEVARWFKATGPIPNARPRYNAAPTQNLLTVLRDSETGECRLEPMLWGLIPFWAKDARFCARRDAHA